MNRILIITGTFAAFLWILVTLMTFGFPAPWARFFDAVTFHALSGPISNMANGFYYDVPNSRMPTFAFLLLFFIIFSMVFYVILRVEKIPSEKHSLKIILFFSVLFRLILLPGELIHENDIYRYLWDAKVFVHGINPYKYAPTDLMVYEGKQVETLMELRDENPVFFQRIGHPQVPTIYPPVAQLVFLFSGAIRPDSILFMKFIFLLFDLGALWLIVRILSALGRKAELAIVYGWSPLVLKEFSNSGHYDPVVIFFMLLSLFCYLKRRKICFVCTLALSALSKFFTAVFLPVFARVLDRRHALVFLGVAGAFYFPFVLWDQAGAEVFRGLWVYNQHWNYNASVFAVIYAVLKQFAPFMAGSLIFPKLIAAALYLAALARLLCRNQHTDDRSLLYKCFVALGLLFIVSPVADPWYFCWVVPFLCIFPYRSWILLSGLLALSYLNFQPGVFEGTLFHIPVLNWIIYVPFLLYWLFERFYQKRRFV
jgi:hypothetical protein